MTYVNLDMSEKYNVLDGPIQRKKAVLRPGVEMGLRLKRGEYKPPKEETVKPETNIPDGEEEE